jgi:hypothetical protein
MRIFIFFLLFLGLTGNCSLNAQDTITFLDGKVLIGKVEDSNDISTKITISKKGKSKLKTKESITIFSIQYADGTMDTLYVPNPEQDLTLSQMEMHYFILGEQDARQYFKPRWTAVGGLIFGAGLGFVFGEGFYVASVPLIYTIGAGLSSVKVTNFANRDSETMINPAYQEGFIKVARIRKSFYALGSSVVGTLAGAIIGQSQN